MYSTSTKKDYVQVAREGCNIKPNPKFKVDKYQTKNDRHFKIPEGRNTQQYKNSFFVRTVVEWNALNNETVNDGSVGAFKARLKRNF